MGVKKRSGIILFQVVTKLLTVDEGGECWLSPENVLLSDMDSREEALQMQLQREPHHGALHLGGLHVKQGHVFTVQDLKSLKVRSDMLLDSFLCFMYNFHQNHSLNFNEGKKMITKFKINRK